MDDTNQTNPMANPVANPADQPAPVAEDQNAVVSEPGQVSNETPAGAPAPTAPVGEEEVKEETPVTPVV